MPKPTPEKDRKAAVAMAVVLGVWVLTVIAGMAMPGYNPPQSVSMAVYTVLGGIFGGVVLQRGQKWVRTREPIEDRQEIESGKDAPGPRVANPNNVVPPPHRPRPDTGWADADDTE